jgi:hypothetical protein
MGLVVQPVYARSADVLWRVGPDRVLVRPPGRGGRDLLGVAAMVWLALDEPRSLSQVEGEISELLDETVDVIGTVDALVGERLISVIDATDP